MDKKPFPDLGLSPELLQAVTSLGFDQPSPIQAAAIPPALAGRDVVGQSQTGSGKTMAFAIPVVQRIDPKSQGPRALILCPTRELAIQVCEQVHKIAQFKPGLRAIPIYGGAAYDRQIRQLRDGSQIVVGTPGRVLDFVSRGVLRLEEVEILVFDEADEMLDRGFQDEIETLVKALPEGRQTLFFSATLVGPIQRLIKTYTRDAEMVTIEHKELTVPTVEQRYYEVQSRSKIEVLCRLLDTEVPRLAMVFANTKKAVDDTTDALIARGYSADRLHGDLNQIMRDRVMKNFRSGTIEILVCTDVAARGLDVDEIDLVVNFDLPYDEEDYVHRIGRTGRAGRTGKAVSMVSGRDIFLLQRIQRFARVKVERRNVPTREEVEGRRADAHFEKLRETLEGKSFTTHEATVQRLLEAGYTPTDIASALMHLWLTESSREAESIQEDKQNAGKKQRRDGDERAPAPRSERPERSERPDRFERSEPFERPERAERPQRDFEPAPRYSDEGPSAPSGPRPAASPEGMLRLFLNIGEFDGVTPREVAGAIYRTCSFLPSGSLGRIEIFGKSSYVGVPEEHVDRVLEEIRHGTWHDRPLRMEIADEQEFREKREAPRGPRYGRGNDRSPPPFRGGGYGDRGGRPPGKRPGGPGRFR